MPQEKNILLFDGVCVLCNGLVQFVLKRDSKAKFQFCTLQSKTGQSLLKQHALSTEDFDSFVLIRGDQFFLRSTAGLHVLKELGGIWKLMYAFIIIPSPLRDILYNFIAKTRYKIFGKYDQCMLPSPEIRDRFLD